jgi:UDP-N-acetylglucosamine 2-epimerase (non-hydrolysing)
VKLLDIVVGARPNFVKIASIVRSIDSFPKNDLNFNYRLIHTGQHYDKRLSADFFTQLGIPEPTVNLEVGSGTQAEQAGAIMSRYENLLHTESSDLCLVVGDVTSTMACAITAQKFKIPVAHVEAGIRSGDWSMPEEINRIVTDSISNWFFTTSITANQNLVKSGVSDNKIFFVGNTMIDTLLFNINRLNKPVFWTNFSLEYGKYFVLTLHRPINVDNSETFAQLIQTISLGSRGLPVIFPVHPRTSKVLSKIVNLPGNIYFIDPQPYLEFIYLIKHAKAVITDSGGISEETTVLGVPCLTLRDTTERPETVDIGTNELVGNDFTSINSYFNLLFNGVWKTGMIPERWDGYTGYRIVNILNQLLSSNNSVIIF